MAGAVGGEGGWGGRVERVVGGGGEVGASRVLCGIQDGRCANLVPKFTLAVKNKIKVVESSSSK